MYYLTFSCLFLVFFFFFNDTATTEIYTLSLHDALPISFAAVKLAAGLLFAAPAVPLLFMGEEYGETAPFHFFTSFIDRELAERVRRGRLEEFSRFGWQGTIADPNAPATFVASRLNHALGGAPRHRALREYYRRWLTLRPTHAALGARDKG